MLLRRVATPFVRAVNSPLTTKIVSGVRKGMEIASLANVPGSAAIAKGLGIAENALKTIQQK